MEPIRLALIEDHHALRQGLELLLGREGCEVVATAGDASAGLEMVRRHAPAELLEAIAVVAGGGTYVDPRLRPALLSRSATQRAPVSGREREIISLLAEGLTGDEVAERLFLSAETVKTHIRNAMAKLEARNRVHAIAIALRDGLIDGVPT